MWGKFSQLLPLTVNCNTYEKRRKIQKLLYMTVDDKGDPLAVSQQPIFFDFLVVLIWF